MHKKGKRGAQKAVPYAVMLFGGMVVVVIFAILLYLLIERFDVLPLYEDNNSISNYLSLIGVSFSVTFITTSLFGGLSDKSEKIYWLSYPEHYLINSSLNFNVLSSLGFVCLAIQVVMIFLKGRYEAIREAVFLSAFVVGIIAIVILSFKFTAVFFSREKILYRIQSEFQNMVEDSEREEELKEAVVGIFNNTLEVTSVEANNMERIKENVLLLLTHDENEMCSFWLTKLIAEIGRTNASLLMQLASLIDNKKFVKFLNIACDTADDSSNFDEAFNVAYSCRLVELNKSLADETMSWQTVGGEVNIIFTKLKTDNIANCIFLLEQLMKLPYELLKNDTCYNTVLIKWDDILVQFAESVKKKSVVSYQKLQKYVFDFLSKHPGTYYDYTPTYEAISSWKEQLGAELNYKTAKCIDLLSVEELPFMIDVIENEKEKQIFLVWLASQMTKKNISLNMWAVSKSAGYNWKGKMEYSKIWIDYLIKELHNKEKNLSMQYEEYRQKNVQDIYTENIPLYEYIDYVRNMTSLLLQVKVYEKESSASSLEIFIEEVVSRVSIGEQNRFSYTVSEPSIDDLEDIEYGEIVNCYVNVFNVLSKEDKNGLMDFCEALTIPHLGGNDIKNYFESEDEKKQKRYEMLFLLEQVNEFVKSEELSTDEIQACAGIMTRVLSNPCILPIYAEFSGNPAEVNESLEYICSNKAALEATELFLEQLDYGEGIYSALSELYTNSENYEAIKEFEMAIYYKKVAEDYENALRALKDSLAI